MAVYVFNGRILPERALLEFRSDPFAPFPIDLLVPLPSGSGQFPVKVSVYASQISVITEIQEEIEDIETLRNLIEQVVRAAVDGYGYLEGRAYDVEISSVVRPDGQLSMVFGVEVRELQQSRSERPVQFQNLLDILLKSPELRRALSDLRESIRSPLDTGFFCFRAIECLRDHFVEGKDGDDKRPSWQRLRRALRIDRSWFDPIERFALPERHGSFPSISGQERVHIMLRTWKVVDRFIQYASQGFQPLPEPPFKLLKEG